MLLPAMDISLAAGLRFQEEVWFTFRSPISRPSLSHDSFALVAAFGRCKFKLCPSSVGFLLQAAIGGLAEHFCVSELSDRVFKFFVSNKSVGFFVHRLGSFSCEQFKVSFHLWGNGGPNWRSEYKLFLAEEDLSWSSASRAMKSFADAVRSPPLSGANAVPVGSVRSRKHPSRLAFPRRSVFDRIEFPKAHAKPVSPAQSSVLPVRCSRCLSPNHLRSSCHQPIRCHACLGWGHVVASCAVSVAHLQRQNPDQIKEKAAAEINAKARWSDRLKEKAATVVNTSARPFDSNATGPTSSSPPIFKSFGELAKALWPSWAATIVEPEVIVPWTLPQSMMVGLNSEAEGSPQHLNPVNWTLNTSSFSPSQHCAVNPSAAAVHARVNPTTVPQSSSFQASPDAASPIMAFARADPRPFVPRGLQWEEVENRVPMVRAVASRTPPASNEDLAIVTFNPLPGNAMNFLAVRDVLEDFLEERVRVSYKEI